MHLLACLGGLLATERTSVDVQQWTKDTLLCNLANDEWPQPQVPVTVIAAIGVLEYVPNYELFFVRARAYNVPVILSYQVVPLRSVCLLFAYTLQHTCMFSVYSSFTLSNCCNVHNTIVAATTTRSCFVTVHAGAAIVIVYSG